MQPELNIGLMGHVDHGKTSITFALTGKWTDTHSEELKRGISIRLGYADYSSYHCLFCGNYQTEPDKCHVCRKELRFLRKISILDAPGHETLMATALASGSLIDGAILVIAANEQCPQAQTSEHLMILKILGVKNIIVVQNKVDVVSREQALNNYKQIVNFLSESGYHNIPIIPVASRLKINVNRLVEAVEKYIPTPARDETKPSRMYIARSFDINKPGTPLNTLKGGTVGGSLISGVIRQGEEIEIAPMPKEYGTDSEILEVVNIYSGNEELAQAKPGGLIAIQTMLDPYWTKSDSLIGSVLGKPGTLPSLYDRITLDYNALNRKDIPQTSFIENETIVLNAGTATAVAFVKSVKKNVLELQLKNRIPIDHNMVISVSRRIKQRWRLMGYGKLLVDR